MVHDFCGEAIVMEKRWYYQMLMEDFGPVTAEQLSALIKEGTLGESDLVRAEDSEDWFEVSRWFPDMVLPETVVESTDDDDLDHITDLSELSFEFESSPTTQKPRRVEPPPAIDPSGFFGEVPATTGNDYVPKVTQSSEPAIYYYLSLGQVFGPLPMSSLIALAENGELSPMDAVRVGEAGNWGAANSIRELSAAFMMADNTMDSSPQLSLATQKRLGTAASAAAMAPDAPQPESVSQESVTPAETKSQDTTTSDSLKDTSEFKKTSSAGAQKSGAKGKANRKEAAKRREDAVMEDIFEDVFSEDEAPPARPAAVYSAPSAPIAAAPTPASPPPQTPAYSPPPVYRPTPAPVPSRSKSSGSSLDGLMPLIKILVILIVIGGVGYGAYLGLSGFAGPPIADYSSKLKAAAEELTKLGDKPTEAQWIEFAKKQTEFSGYQNTILATNAAGPDVDKCKMAITMLLRVTSTRFKDPVKIKKTKEDFLAAVKRLP